MENALTREDCEMLLGMFASAAPQGVEAARALVALDDKIHALHASLVASAPEE